MRALAIAFLFLLSSLSQAQPVTVWVYGNPADAQVGPEEQVVVAIGLYTVQPTSWQSDAVHNQWQWNYWIANFEEPPTWSYQVRVVAYEQPVFDTAGNLVFLKHPEVVRNYTSWTTPVIQLDEWELSIP